MAAATRVDHYAAQFAAVNDEIIAHVTACDDQQWRQSCTNDERSVGVVAHHVADVNQAFARIVETLAAGETYTPQTSMDEVHQSNAQHAQEHVAASRTETLVELRKNGDVVSARLRSLKDAQLDHTAGLFGGHALTVAQVIEYVVIGHAAEHLESIRLTLAD